MYLHMSKWLLIASFIFAYFHVSKSVLIFAKNSYNLNFHRCSLDTFYQSVEDYICLHIQSNKYIKSFNFIYLYSDPLSGCSLGTSAFCSSWSRLTDLPLDKMDTTVTDDIFKCNSMDENFNISIRISLKFVPHGPIDNKAELVQVMVSNRQQGMTWTNADPVHWRIYAASRRDKFKTLYALCAFGPRMITLKPFIGTSFSLSLSRLLRPMCHIFLTHWGRDKKAAVSQTTLSKAFSWMKILEFRLKFHWFLRVQLTIFLHWFR